MPQNYVKLMVNGEL